MIGNVWEWTQDWWVVEHSKDPKTNPVSLGKYGRYLQVLELNAFCRCIFDPITIFQ